METFLKFCPLLSSFPSRYSFPWDSHLLPQLQIPCLCPSAISSDQNSLLLIYFSNPSSPFPLHSLYVSCSNKRTFLFLWLQRSRRMHKCVVWARKKADHFVINRASVWGPQWEAAPRKAVRLEAASHSALVDFFPGFRFLFLFCIKLYIVYWVLKCRQLNLKF